MNIPALINSMYGDVWAIVPHALRSAVAIYDTTDGQITDPDASVRFQDGAFWAHRGTPEARTGRLPKVEGNVGVLPLTGIITQRSGNGLMEMLFGGTKVDVAAVGGDRVAAQS